MKPIGLPSSINLQDLPHDISGLFNYGFRWNWWFVGILIFVVFLAWWVYNRFYKTKKVKKHVLVDPFSDNVKRIKNLLPVLPYHRKNQEQFYFELSFYLRTVLEITQKFRATDSTLRELRKPLLHSFSSDSSFARDILSFLERAEMIKFAEKDSSEEESLKIKEQVLIWVLSLKPKETEGSKYFDSLEKKEK